MSQGRRAAEDSTFPCAFSSLPTPRCQTYPCESIAIISSIDALSSCATDDATGHCRLLIDLVTCTFCLSKFASVQHFTCFPNPPLTNRVSCLGAVAATTNLTNPIWVCNQAGRRLLRLLTLPQLAVCTGERPSISNLDIC